MKIVIRKSIRDDYDCDMLQSEQDINPLSYALTKRFLRKNGDLFQKLLGSFLLVPNIRIVLIADEGKDKEVLRLRLDIDRKDLWMSHEISNLQGMLQIMEALFQTTRTFNHTSQYTKRDCGVYEMDEKRTTNN